jgi:flagellar basal-body rod protein FlgC
MFGVLDTSTSALVAQRIRMDTIAGNIANAWTTADAEGNPSPYRRRVALFEPGNPSGIDSKAGVHVARIVEDPSPPRLVYDPGHPHAIQGGRLDGYVRYPNVDLGTEMVNAIEAMRAYEANITAMEVTKSMIAASLRLLA